MINLAACKEWYALYNIIFNWMQLKYGYNEFYEYIKTITHSCFGSQINEIRLGGLCAIKEYYCSLFDEDGTDYLLEESENQLCFTINKCIEYEVIGDFPYLNGNACKHYCRHHLLMNEVLILGSGIKFDM